MTGVRVIVYGGRAGAKTHYVPHRSFVYDYSLTARQRALMGQLLAEHRRVPPAPVKPALRGRRHGW